MPFDDEYPLEPVDAEEEPGYGEPWEDRELNVKDLEYLGAEVEADTVRKLVQEQVELWRQVPDLVLEVEGRKGYNARSAATFHGYYQVSPEAGGRPWSSLPRVYVDCASGELVSASYIRTPPIPEDAVQEEVLDVLEANGDMLQPETVKEKLAPRYDADQVDQAINEMYKDGLSLGPDFELQVERPDVSPASDRLVEQMAADYPARLDAERTVARLEERSDEPHSSAYDPEKQEAWRERIREQLDLGPVFTRD